MVSGHRRIGPHRFGRRTSTEQPAIAREPLPAPAGRQTQLIDSPAPVDLLFADPSLELDVAALDHHRRSRPTDRCARRGTARGVVERRRRGSARRYEPTNARPPDPARQSGAARRRKWRERDPPGPVAIDRGGIDHQHRNKPGALPLHPGQPGSRLRSDFSSADFDRAAGEQRRVSGTGSPDGRLRERRSDHRGDGTRGQWGVGLGANSGDRSLTPLPSADRPAAEHEGQARHRAACSSPDPTLACSTAPSTGGRAGRSEATASRLAADRPAPTNCSRSCRRRTRKLEGRVRFQGATHQSCHSERSVSARRQGSRSRSSSSLRRHHRPGLGSASSSHRGRWLRATRASSSAATCSTSTRSSSARVSV